MYFYIQQSGSYGYLVMIFADGWLLPKEMTHFTKSLKNSKVGYKILFREQGEL